MANPKTALETHTELVEQEGSGNPSVAAENVSVIDAAPLDAIRAVQPPGGESLLGRIIALYIEESARLKAQIAVGIERGDGNLVRESAHSLKSSSANVGATRVAGLSRDLETRGRAGDLEEADMLFAQLDGELDYAVAELKTLID